ncbi:hypothetical protein [Nocardioides sp. KR10-350]|uniref:hypothetical protein n=1 Tax=Nocardioides cheoyonin TaxID=3156615 RepID=UPI0032B4D74F
MRARRKASSTITVGTRPLEDFHVRQAKDPHSRVLAGEARDWLLVKSLLHPGERPLARVAVRFPHEGKAAGHAFLTDLRVMFEFREKVFSINLGAIVFAGRPPGPSLGDFVVEAMVPDRNGMSRFSTTMRVRDEAAFHDFFPTLLAAARAAGAQPAVDTDWAGDAAPPAPVEPPAATTITTGRQEDLPEHVIVKALSGFLHQGETVVAAADMVHNMSEVALKVFVTGERLIVVEGTLIWAADLGQVHLVYAGGAQTHLRLLVGSVDDSLTLGSGTATVTEQRRLVLRSRYDQLACERIHAHLAEHAGGVLQAWPD